jgi:LysM repeat protein
MYDLIKDRPGHAMKTIFLIFLLLGLPLLVFGCASDPAKNDLKVMQTVYKQQSVKDQQTINDLRRDLESLQRDLKAADAARAASEGKLAEALRRVEQQRDELTRAKEERSQFVTQMTTQLAPISRQLTEELARAREERAQFAQTMKQLAQHTVELERLRQNLAESGQNPRLQSIETAVNKQNEAMAALQVSIQGIHESLAEAQRKAEEKAQPQASAAPPSGKRKQTAVSKDKSSAPPSRTIIVKAGDTLKSLAEKYEVTPAQLKEMNRLTTDDIKVGQSLTVPSVNKPNGP